MRNPEGRGVLVMLLTSAAMSKLLVFVLLVLQYFLDKSTPHYGYRWLGTGIAAFLYIVRVFSIKGFYIVTYGPFLRLLRILTCFLSSPHSLVEGRVVLGSLRSFRILAAVLQCTSPRSYTCRGPVRAT